MMQDSTNKKKNAAIICAVIFITLLALYFGLVFFPLLGISIGDGAAIAILIIYSLIILFVIVGILIALRQRLHEIEGGEEEDAKKY